jgi:hypothetical protein
MYRVSPDRRSHVFAQALQHETHRELVYRSLQFHECCEDFFGTDDETFSVAMRVYNPDGSPLQY